MPAKLVEQILQTAHQEQRRSLLEPEAKQICQAYDMPIPPFGVARTRIEAADIAVKVNFPVVLKVISEDILHKTEAGGVLLGIGSKEGVESGYDKIYANVLAYNEKARIRGVLIQHMCPQGPEVIVGGIRDSQFGPTILFGLGGIFVEVMKDASFRVAPITEFDSREMIREIRGHQILEGVRGQPPADEETIMRILLSTSNIMIENQGIQQIDLNPIIVYAKGASIVDARMILGD